MSVYLIVLIMTAYLSKLAESRAMQFGIDEETNIRTNGNIFLFLIVALLVIIAGFRYYIGTDYNYYYNYNPQLHSLYESIGLFKESGFYLLAVISRKIYNNGITLIFISSFITVTLYVTTIYKYSPSFYIGMLLYIMMGEWTGAFNGVRQYLAAAILFSGHRFILERKFLRYCLVVLLAMSFHATSVVMLFPFLIYNRKPDVKQLIILLIGVIIIRYSYDNIFSAIGLIKGTEMSIDQYSYYHTSVNQLRILVYIAPIIIFLTFCDRSSIQEQDYIYFNGLLFNSFSMLAAAKSAYLARVAIFTAPIAIIGYSYLFVYLKNSINRQGVITACLLLYFIYFMFQIKNLGFAWWF